MCVLALGGREIVSELLNIFLCIRRTECIMLNFMLEYVSLTC